MHYICATLGAAPSSSLKQSMSKDFNKIWTDVLETIKVSVSPAIFSTWFVQTHLASLKELGSRSIAEVGCNSSYVKTTIETRYFGLVQDALSARLGTPCDVLFLIKTDPNKEVATVNSTPLFSVVAKNNLLDGNFTSSALRPRLTFDNFAVSPSNQMAWAAAEAVSKNLGSAYNPLFIWGGVGVGKTHLMNAVGCFALSKNPDYPVLFCTGEQFTNDIVEGIRNKSTPAVRNKYRKLKILMIDDIQFIAGKDTVQEEFFHTFNALVSAGSQVILTSDKPPSEISKLEERLRSRFEAGLIVDIAPPDFELRCAIAQIKAKEKGIDLPMDMIQLIAGNLDGARRIEGFLVRLSSEVMLKKSEISVDMIESLLGRREPQDHQTKKTPDEMVDAVIKYFSVKKRDILGKSRARPIARPRQILMYLMRTILELPLEEIGRVVGNRDHTTVMHAVEKITHMASVNVKIREDIKGIKSSL